MKFETRFCTSADGTRIAYAIRRGTAPPVLRVHGWATMIGADSFFSGWESSQRTLVVYDRRGTGASTREVGDICLDRQVEDVAAVVAALGADSVDVLAFWDGTPIAIAYAAQHQNRVGRISLYGPYLRGTDVISREALRSTMDLAQSNWLMLRRSMTTMGGRDGAEVEKAMEVLRRGISPDMAARSIELYGTMDVEAYVDLVSAPTLIMHRPHDGAVTFTAVREVASRIRDSRLVTTAETNPARDAGIREFLDPDHRAEPTGARIATAISGADVSPFRTILFTDIVGHTEMMQRLGDARGRDVLREHERITRETLKQHGGAEVKTMGDGFMASFGSVTKAMECAIALQRAFASHTESMPEPLHVRVGLNAGEPIEEDGDLFGAAVILASRIAAEAAGGEILVPDTVRGLLSGKAFTFSDRGEYAMKGFADAVRLYEVRWRE